MVVSVVSFEPVEFPNVPKIWDGKQWVPAEMFRPLGSALPQTVLWLEVTVRASSFGNCGEGGLYIRRITFAHPPEVGGDDQICLYPSSDDPDDLIGGPMWGFKRRYWDVVGALHLELQTMHVDPQGPLAKHFKTRRFDDPSIRRDRVWHTDQDGDPRPSLLAGGWAEYAGSP